jgi:hypothetical protein
MEKHQDAMREISLITGKLERELIKSYQQKKPLDLMQQAKGIWKERDDLP